MKSIITPENSLLLVIDIQEKFRNVINQFDKLINNSKKLIKVANILKIPILVTEQYTKGLGETVNEIKETLKEYTHLEKVSFDCFGDKNFIKKLKGKPNIIICGIEAHICVFQTALSALENKFNVYLIADAVSSRKEADCNIALRRLESSGAKLASTEMIIFQMIIDSKDTNFKDISKIVK